jgi:hypothetical protein
MPHKTIHLSLRIDIRSAKLLRHWSHLDRVSRAALLRDLIAREERRRGHSLKSIKASA